MIPDSGQLPLRVWFYTAALIGALLLFLANQERLPGFARRISAASDTLLNLQRVNRPELRATHIVALGSSKTQYALDYDDDFAQRIAAPFVPVVFHRITWERANFWDLEPALRALRAHPPEVLLLESDLLLFDRGARFPIRQDLLPLERWLHARLGGRDQRDENYAQNRGTQTFPSNEECAARRSEPARLIYAAHLATTRLSSPASRARYLEFLTALQRAGTRVILIRLPRAAWARALVPPTIAHIESAVLPALAQKQGFELWTTPPMPAEAFCDEAHMTAVGRSIYSRWLASRLEEKTTTLADAQR